MNKLARKNCIKNSLAAVCIVAAMSFSSANAAQNIATLSGVQISPSTSGSYQITLESDKNISVKKQIKSNNYMVLDLKGVKASEALNTIYKDVKNIDHVIFQPVSKNHIKVLLKGKNIAQSNISVNNSFLPLSAISKETLTLNKPINTYKPVISEEEELTLDPTTSTASGFAIKDIANKQNAGWLVSFAMMMVLLAIGVKSMAGKDKKVKIALNDNLNLKEREIALHKGLTKNQGIIGKGLGAKPSTSIARNTGVSSIKNYGIKEYQTSQSNPKTGMSRAINRPTKAPAGIALKSKPIKTRRSASKKITQNDIAQAKANINSMQFLESMAKIYEKSGRADLANGLQNNIMKAKIANAGF